VPARLRLREGHHLADVALLREQCGPAIDADRDPAMRWGAEVEGVEDRPELLVHRLGGVTLEGERALEEVAPPDANGAAAELPAVEDDVVLHRPRAAGRVARRGPVWIARRGDQQRLVLGQHARERVVRGVPALV